MSEMTTFFQSKKLEDILVEMRLMKKEDIAALVVECQNRRKSLLEVILEKKLLDETSVYKALATQSNLEFMDLKNYEAPRLLFSILPINLLKMQNLVPVKKEGNILTIATSDPSSFFSVQSIRMVTGLNIKLVVSQKAEIIRIKTKIIDETTQAKSQIPERGAGLFGGPAGPAEKKTAIKSVNISEVIDDLNLEFVSSSPEQVNLEEALIESRQKPVMAFVNKTILEAVKKQASDIHFERMENNCRIRFRIDGELYDQYSIEREAHEAIVSRIKVVSNLDITEKSMPQDGSFKLKIEDSFVDFRVSVFPSIYGQNVVIRVLNRRVVPLDLNRLGFSPRCLENYKSKIAKPYGMILVTGPTGSGKTTTLYSSLLQINDGGRKIITIEDPVEFQLEGINQTQVVINKNDPTKSLTFSLGLRSILRQDPDVIMIGEIRDHDSAEIAINASMTGHLVFSTVHANHSVEVLSRIKSLKVDVNLFMDCVNLIITQRLVRRICPNCKTLVTDLAAEFENLKMVPVDFGDAKVYKGAGCELCSYTGYMGRLGVFEFFDISEKIKENISAEESIFKIKKIAIEEGLITLRDACVEKVKLGETTIEELKSISMED